MPNDLEQTPIGQFVDAVLAFSDDPDPANLSRYLTASRVLEESRLTGPTRRSHLPATHVNDGSRFA